MRRHFPVFLNLDGKKILVVGAGPVAQQKIRSLLAAGAKVRVVARDIPPGRIKNVKYEKRVFRSSDIAAQDLVFCATDDEALNRLVGRLCRARRIWVNVADCAPLCSFIMPSVFRRGKITAAFSTGGASPAVARFVRERLEKNLGPDVDALVSILKAARGKLMRLDMERRKKLLKRIVTEKTLFQIRKGESAAVRNKLIRILKRR